jgi:CheY-like chemotaxis protein
MTSSCPKILVIDDDDDIVQMLELILSQRGYKVVTAADGSEALDYLESHEPPALIFLDLMLPRLSGVELLGHLRRDERLESTPVIILSGDWLGERVASECQVAGYLRKPVELVDVFHTVERFVEL